jgi:helix-turn-helix protein
MLIFIEISCNGIDAGKSIGKGFPNPFFSFLINSEDSFTACRIIRFGNFVVRIIWEEGEIVVFSSSGQSSITGNKHPVIRIADNAHKKRPQ